MTYTHATAQGQNYYLFIGTYSPADHNGIFVYRFNTVTGKADPVSTVSGIENPSYFCISADHHFLYAVSETHGGKGGHIYAYRFDNKSGKLTKLNTVLSEGDDPCYIHQDKTGRWLFVANYTSGSLAVFPVEKDGSVGKAIQTIQHHGHSIHLPQQSKAHVHCTLSSPDNRHLLVADLGVDKIFTYTLNDKNGHLSAGNPPYTNVSTGSGPRHLLFSEDGKYMYSIHELGGIITVFKNDHGKLAEEQIISTVPHDYRGRIWAAEIKLSPDGSFLYAVNRDDLNDIIVYSVNRADGKLTYLEHYPTGGKTLRDFTLSPDGNYLLAGQRNGKDVLLYKRDQHAGKLSPAEQRIPVACAVCLKMIPVL